MERDYEKEYMVLIRKYELKKKTTVEKECFEQLKMAIKSYGYNTICEIIFKNKENKNSTSKLENIINDLKRKNSIELLCSQLFYLEDSYKNEVLFHSEKGVEKGKKINISKRKIFKVQIEDKNESLKNDH